MLSGEIQEKFLPSELKGVQSHTCVFIKMTWGTTLGYGVGEKGVDLDA